MLDIDISKVDYRGESKIMHFDAKVEDAEGRKVTDSIDVKLPCKHSIPLNPFDVSRHFILNAKFYGKSLKDNDFITVNIISNHHEDRFYYAGKPVRKIFLLKNKFSTLEFTEIRPHRFIINDLDNSEIDWRIEWLHKRLSADEISVANDINALSANVDELSSEISTAIQRNRDDVSFFGDVHLKDKYNECDSHNHLSDLIATNDDTNAKGKVQYGFMYRCKAPAGRETEQFWIWNDDAQTSAFLKDNMYFVVNRKSENDTIPLNELKYNDVAFFNNFDIDVANLSAYARQIELSASQISTEINRLCTEISNDLTAKYDKLVRDDSFISAEIGRLCTEISNDIVTKYSKLTSDDNFISGEVDRLCSEISNDLTAKYSWLSGETDRLCIAISTAVALSAAALCTEISNLSDEVSAISNDLSSAISSKIWIKDLNDDGSTLTAGNMDALSVIKIAKDDFDAQVVTGTLTMCSNTLYVVSSDYIDAYGRQLCNLTMTEDMVASEAANKHYVDAKDSKLATDINAVSSSVEVIKSKFNADTITTDPVLAKLLENKNDSDISTVISAVMYIFNTLTQV